MTSSRSSTPTSSSEKARDEGSSGPRNSVQGSAESSSEAKASSKPRRGGNHTGLFLALDGIDGVGKSTQLEMLHDWLTHRGFEVVRCRDPGGTGTGEKIRELLLDDSRKSVPLTEMLLFMASRAQLVAEVIRPALVQGHVVLCDRFVLSTLAYQSHTGGVPRQSVLDAFNIATGGLWPDWIGLLDLDPQQAAHRRGGPRDHLECQPDAYFQKVREGYLNEAKRRPDRCRVISAGADPQQVHQALVKDLVHVVGPLGRT